MSHIRKLGCVLAAMFALTVVLGASSASATVICTKAESPCTSFEAHSEIHADLILARVDVIWPPSYNECKGGTMRIAISNYGGASQTVVGSVAQKDLTWECGVTTVNGGKFEIHHFSGGYGTVTGSGFELEEGNGCRYGLGSEPVYVANLTDSVLREGKLGHGYIHLEAYLKKTGGGFFCGSELSWRAEYTVTKPNPLFVESS